MTTFYLTMASLEQILTLAEAVNKGTGAEASCEIGDVNIRIFGGGMVDVEPAIKFTLHKESE